MASLVVCLVVLFYKVRNAQARLRLWQVCAIFLYLFKVLLVSKMKSTKKPKTVSLSDSPTYPSFTVF